MNKKGISPLIATVLLISFVVILSGVIMFWGRQYVTELIEKRGDVAVAKLDCERVEIEIIDNDPLTIRNNGPLKLSGFMLKFDTGDSGEYNKIVQSYEEAVVAFGRYVTSNPSTVNVIPMLRPSGIGAPPIPCSTKHKLVRLT